MTSIDTTRHTHAFRVFRVFRAFRAARNSMVVGFAAVFASALVSACSSSSSGTTSETTDASSAAQTTCPVIPAAQPAAGTCSAPGGASPGGGPDTRCAAASSRTVQPTGVCQTSVSADAASAGGDDGGGGGFVDDGRCGESGYQPTIYGTSGSDDDCKYDVSWTSTPICNMQPVYFTVTAKKRSATRDAEDTPLTGASVRIESYFYDCNTTPPNIAQSSAEIWPGVYKVGPVEFSKTGRWNVRFHFNECCSDIPADSPHGHAAFWVDAP